LILLVYVEVAALLVDTQFSALTSATAIALLLVRRVDNRATTAFHVAELVGFDGGVDAAPVALFLQHRVFGLRDGGQRQVAIVILLHRIPVLLVLHELVGHHLLEDAVALLARVHLHEHLVELVEHRQVLRRHLRRLLPSLHIVLGVVLGDGVLVEAGGEHPLDGGVDLVGLLLAPIGLEHGGIRLHFISVCVDVAWAGCVGLEELDLVEEGRGLDLEDGGGVVGLEGLVVVELEEGKGVSLQRPL